ncbi:type II secretion system protein GspL [Panacagrimonas sp.]|uniref:type II secretion system protein GspL n=1 Tax=Panacagrimonas sp. TaxID=2480088 RepID=UPI003B52F0B1
MRETLYIRLGATPADDVRFATGTAEARSLEVRNGSLHQAAALAAGRRVVVFAPAADVRLTAVAVPARQVAKVLQALPYALEDQVAEDIDTLHFSLGPRQADGRYPVAIVSHTRLQSWLAPLREHGLRPDVLTPEVLALPVDPGGESWSGLADGEYVVVRTGSWSGFACHVGDLPGYLHIAAGDGKPPLRLLVCGDSAADWTQLDWPLHLLPGHGDALSALAVHWRDEHAINLLQGVYSQQQDLQKFWKPWRVSAALLALWLLVLLVGVTVDNARLAAALQAQDQANLQRFQQLFPSQTRVVNLEAQLDQQLRALGGGAAGGPLVLIEVLSQALKASPGLKLGGMQYRDGALFLSMTASDLQVLENLRNWFAGQRAATLEVQSANAESGSVQIRARLNPA